MRKVLLDTSIILDDTNNLVHLFECGDMIFISDVALEELDRKKDLQSESGYFAREFFRCIEDSKQNTESIESITPLNDDFIATLEFKTQSYKIPLHIITRKKYKTQSSDYGYNDARIREIAKDYNLVLLTNDIALKVRSLSEGIRAKSLKNGQISNPKEINFITKITLKRDLSDKAEFESSPDFKTHTNWHIFEISECDFTDSARYFTGRKYFGVKVNNALEILDLDSIIKENKPYILPLNIEQKLAYALLIHPQNFLSIITGSTGSGKTLMALLAGLTLQKLNKVDGIIYLRNTITANDKEAELGFRKGDESQKLHYFMYPLFSSINFIIESLKEHSEAKRIEYKGEAKGFDKDEATYYFLQKHNIEMLDIAHARGISLHNKFVIFDEVQNASNATIKLIGTRIGENSRIVFLGDYNQIDHPYLSKTRNGAISMLNKALSEDFVFGLQFKHTIRSILASWFDANF
ncbi:AAA family ATPase [Helicobacter saguini]|uniref:AAA family ATPase n=1 Tax=Helicobacter saguini TaxID=1548018 RepID=A0A347VRZ8_9HELI|nr:PhoH family protein [Helicobacter saguini]MWV62712.1 AAA family ATPase [Helicobacter saguini]MWV66617.1 AAA family ATPase [Helicobacter saguini]MWV68967.1 AAA family ATPase [Helicobacter saguini]MWV71480.1 AAA family ATPase [Helicobacter saguini]TLD94122.1 phosphate starvation-inducible protein PhoH [Helicobacter saguini]